MNSHTYFVSYVSFVFLFLYKAMGLTPIDTTSGFVSQPLNQSNFDLQKPYDVALEQRYSFSNGFHKLWVFKTDKPHSRTSKTLPRTEIRFRGYDYSSGV
ncbi:hypothetical protein L1987_18561 [Smallanthus sonchifolius]|uniref:Uncharacterized protein n=1 Tax=Smallanthus sonchifolius TaxID=185202 RepID=A0ACB9J295_9ASTR|nr:hypothetical protein L1987_18561 [Smallanthus sonchifolius]